MESWRGDLRAVEPLSPLLTEESVCIPDESVWGLSGGRGAGLGVTRPGFQLDLELTSWAWEKDRHASGGHSPKPNIGTHRLTNTRGVGRDRIVEGFQ